MLFYKKSIFIIISCMVLGVFSSCGEKTNTWSSDQEVTEEGTEPVDDAGFYESYLNSISKINGLEPYYRFVFAFEALPNGISSAQSKI